jgi:hypothetical protein
MNKMKDVFDLPVTAYCGTLPDVWRIEGIDQVQHAAFAVNMHDKLVDAVTVLVNHPKLADMAAIKELIKVVRPND